jgi:hypothetical protein
MLKKEGKLGRIAKTRDILHEEFKTHVEKYLTSHNKFMA